ncbi:hypothetical protein DM793_03495 [Paenarthrobacter nitroguajacolicus]|uniref:hypothetical protein n=1 Tax=Paenarthrobacter nitroguajacolicus TaxID=211146 RepID=UPI0015BE83C5|nr:hypothetical protein [Paenarthrobacter nitroguajacolicus]NWL10368.1 hypothetical protein [Paenarthrobacter nitroguajacolicus]
MNTVIKIYLLARILINGLREEAEERFGRLRLRAEAGDGAAGWVLILIGVIAIAAIVIAAVTAFVQSKTAQLQ